jgi:hypothetical protein
MILWETFGDLRRTTAITKTLAKEVAPFNVRALFVSLGTFNTDMPYKAQKGEVPLDDAYEGSMVDKVMNALSRGSYTPQGDKDKAVKVIFEVVTATGDGQGRENEVLVPLGKDCLVRVEEVRDGLNHTIEVLGEMAKSVALDP